MRCFAFQKDDVKIVVESALRKKNNQTKVFIKEEISFIIILYTFAT